MKKFLAIIALTLYLMNCQQIKLRDNMKFFVSQTGNDSWSGKFSEPNKEKTDGPFATLKQAQKAVRQIIREGDLPAKGVTIYLKQGNYFFPQSIEFNETDSGTENAPVIWQAFPGEKVNFIGGIEVSGFNKVTDENILERIDNQYRDKILNINLKKFGISDFGEIKPRGGPGIEIF